jgi:rod shape-determining protein MreD
MPFAILLYLTTVLQVTLAPFFAVHGIRFDLMVILAVHYALAARSGDAQIACWSIGLAVDLCSLGYQHHANVGINAIAFGLLGWLIVTGRELTFRDSVVTQLMFTFMGRLMVSIVVGMHMMYVLGAWNRFGEVLLIGLYSAVYTALIAPYGHWFLKRMRGLLGIGAPHRVRVG